MPRIHTGYLVPSPSMVVGGDGAPSVQDALLANLKLGLAMKVSPSGPLAPSSAGPPPLLVSAPRALIGGRPPFPGAGGLPPGVIILGRPRRTATGAPQIFMEKMRRRDDEYVPPRELDRRFAVYSDAVLAPATKSTYECLLRSWVYFQTHVCRRAAWPLTYDAVADFFIWRIHFSTPGKTLSVSTLKGFMSALRFYLDSRRWPFSLSTVDLSNLKALKRSLAHGSLPVDHSVAPLTGSLLLALEASFGPTPTPAQAMRMTAYMTALAALLRVGEYTGRALNCNQVSYVFPSGGGPPQSIQLALFNPEFRAKTAHGTGAHDAHQYAYLHMAPLGGVAGMDRLQRHMDEHHLWGDPGPLFWERIDGVTGRRVPYTKDRLRAALRADLQAAGLVGEMHYSTHSLRRGGASELYRMGVDPADIKAMGRWKSMAWLLYISLPAGDFCARMNKALTLYGLKKG